MAGYPDWMNPNPQTAHMDRLLNNPAAGILPERMQTRERVEPPWQVPWQGNADFVTDIPGRQQSNLGAPAFNMESTMVPFEDEEYFGAGRGAPAPLPDDPLRLQQYLGREEPISQTQRPAKPTREWPVSGTSIADSFMGGLRRGWNTLTSPRDPEVGRQFNQGPAELPFFLVF